MKILKLNLTAFGPFTETSLDLSGGQEGLHVIFGPNEAGKSSSLRAIADLFYGIHPRTPDDFVHRYSRLRVGAQLKHSDGAVLDLIRRKANQNSLRTDDDSTLLDESELNRFLGDVDRDLFHVMFGIDHERLRSGGEEIVKGGGRIGELLFAAGAGLADLQKVQTTLNDEVNRLLKSSGRSGEIADGIKEFQGNRNAVKEAQISVETWRRLDEGLRTAQSQKSSLDKTIREKRSEQSRLTRIRDAVSAIGRWNKAVEDLAQVSKVPLLAEDFSDTSNEILIDLRKAEQQKEDAEASIADIDGALKGVTVPEELLQESDAIESLRDRQGGHRKAMSDRPKLETSRALAESDAKEILRKLGRAPDLAAIEDLRIPADKTIRIQNLGNLREGLIERLQSTRRDCERTRQKITLAEGKIRDIQVPAGANGLRTTIREIQKEGDLESQVEVTLKEIDGLQQDATVALSQLALWSGSVEETERLAVPSLVTVEQFAEELKEENARLMSLRDRLQEEIDARGQLEAQLKQLESTRKVPTTDELTTMRCLREQGWQLILKAWRERHENKDDIATFLREFAPLEDLAEAYHRSVDEADHISDSLRSDADRVAMKAKLRVDRDQQISLEGSIAVENEQSEARLKDLDIRWNEVWEPLVITPLSPLEMRDWLRQQQEISQAAAGIRAKQNDADKIEGRVESLADEISSAIAEVEPGYSHDNRSLREQLLYASNKCDEIQNSEHLLEQVTDELESNRSDLLDAESRFADSELALTNWQFDWSVEMNQIGLQEDAMPAQANSVLEDIRSLFQKYQESDQFRTRLDGIDRDAREFDADVLDLIGRASPDLAVKPVEEVVSLLTTQLKTAHSAEEKHASLIQQKDEQQKKLRRAKERISEINASLDEMCRQAGCAGYDQLSEAARQSRRRRELERSVGELEEQIISHSGGTDFKSFLSDAEKEAADVDSLQPRIDEFDVDVDRLSKERDDFLRQIEREESELRKIDGSALASEKAAQCESIASRLENQVQELAALRVASAILHAGIEQHRKKNQGPVLGRASKIFSQITVGVFDELRADFNEQGEPILTGVRSANSEMIPVSGMSDGTCDQLYLALRLASLETWLDRHEPIPFIVDDVLLNFDDDRAVASLKVLAELSHRTQIIFFTHHSHLVEMARNNLSSTDLFVQTLS